MVCRGGQQCEQIDYDRFIFVGMDVLAVNASVCAFWVRLGLGRSQDFTRKGRGAKTEDRGILDVQR